MDKQGVPLLDGPVLCHDGRAPKSRDFLVYEVLRIAVKRLWDRVTDRSFQRISIFLVPAGLGRAVVTVPNTLDRSTNQTEQEIIDVKIAP
jgi:hypothetical protein